MGTALDTQTVPVADDDRGYAGSRYSDVVAAIFANPYQRIWGGAGEPALPVYEVTFTSVFSRKATVLIGCCSGCASSCPSRLWKKLSSATR